MDKRDRFKGIKVTPFLTGLLLAVLAAQACARPSPAVVDACLRTEGTASHVRYTPIDNKVIDVTEDEEAGKTGRSGSFQNIRGLYLIERRGRNTATFYTAGNIASTDKQH